METGTGPAKVSALSKQTSQKQMQQRKNACDHAMAGSTRVATSVSYAQVLGGTDDDWKDTRGVFVGTPLNQRPISTQAFFVGPFTKRMRATISRSRH